MDVPDDQSEDEKEDDKEEIDPKDKYPLDKRYGNPFKFIQRADGSIAEILFHQKDLSKTNVLNFKRGIVSAFQTSTSDEDAVVEETDQMGSHKTKYKVLSGKGKSKKLQKQFAASDIKVEGAEIEGDEEQDVEDGKVVNGKGTVKIKSGTTGKTDMDNLGNEENISPLSSHVPVETSGLEAEVTATYTLERLET
ncbi:unnamed protein product, partial [Owenia fusiformis]